MGPTIAPPDNEATGDEGVDLGQLWSTIRESRRFILIFAALLFSVVMAHALLSPMTFRTTGRLYLGELEATGRAVSDIDISGSGQGDVGSEIEILKSKSLISRGILDSGLNVAITPVGWKPPRFWEWLASDRDTRVLDIAPKELAAVNTSLADNSRGSQRYTITFITQDEYEVRSEERLLGSGRLGDTLTLDGLTVALIHGTERGPQPGGRYTMVVHPLDVVTDQIMEALTVASPKAVGAESAKVVNLEFTDRSPYFAATFLRKLMRGYLDERQAWKTEDASAAESFVTDQLQSLRKELDRSEKKLADYRSNTRGVVLDNEAKVMIEQVGTYEEQRVAARLQVAALSEVKRALKLPNPPTEAFLLGEANDTVLAGLSHSLADARQSLDDAKEQFGESSPQARQQRAQVDVQLQMIRSYVANRLSRAEENLSELNKIIGQFEEKLRTVPGAELGLAQLGRESEVYSRVYSYMLERQQQAAITKASTVSKNRILDFPQVPYREDAPKLILRFASAPLALLLGAVLVLLHRMFASSMQSESEVRRALFGVPIYASIPLRPRLKGKRKELSDAHCIDVLARAQSAPFAEAFRTLRTNLYHWGTTNQGRVTLFTSPSPGDGKTTCVLSLAAILAADKKRVLVVDADLRKPSHHDLTEAGQGPGLRGILSGQCHWIDVVHPVRLSVGVYDSIAAGKMAPAELLSSERMSRFLNDAKAHYDFILLDSPSFPLVSDALVLATVSDCVLSVFRLRNTPRKLALEHVRGLSSTTAMYGAIINDTQTAGTHYPMVGRGRHSDGPSEGRWRRRVLGTAACLGVAGVGVAAYLQGRSGALDAQRPAGVAELGAGRVDGAAAVVGIPPAPPKPAARLPILEHPPSASDDAADNEADDGETSARQAAPTEPAKQAVGGSPTAAPGTAMPAAEKPTNNPQQPTTAQPATGSAKAGMGQWTGGQGAAKPAAQKPVPVWKPTTAPWNKPGAGAANGGLKPSVASTALGKPASTRVWLPRKPAPTATAPAAARPTTQTSTPPAAESPAAATATQPAQPSPEAAPAPAPTPSEPAPYAPTTEPPTSGATSPSPTPAPSATPEPSSAPAPADNAAPAPGAANPSPNASGVTAERAPSGELPVTERPVQPPNGVRPAVEALGLGDAGSPR